MKFKITLFFILLFHVFIYTQTPASSISTTHIRFGEPVVLKLKVQGKKTDNVIFPVLQDTLAYHLDILEIKKNILNNNGNYYYIDSIIFSGYEEGTFIVPSQKIIVNSKEYFTTQYKITVSPVLIDSLNKPLFDIRPIITEPKNFGDYFQQYWLYMIMGGIILIVAIIVAVLYYLDRKKKKTDDNNGTNPDIVAIKKIEKLEKSNYLDKGLSKKYYSEMIAILKEYMENRWKFSATKLLTEDLIEYIKRKKWIDEKEEQNLALVFKAADLAKFAKSKPTSLETKTHTEIVKKFINDTKAEFYNFREHDEY